MTTYSKITIDGTEITDAWNCNVRKAIGDINSSSSFTMNFDNTGGTNGSRFTVGEEVIIYAEKDTDPPTEKIFTGILEDIKHTGKETREKIIITGRDYSARLQDRTVEPEVYNNMIAGSIIQDIITKYTNDITLTNVSDVSGAVIDRIVFNHVPVFDAIKQLSDLSTFTFYVDEDKDLHFEEKGETSSGKTFDNTNILRADFKEQRDTLYNQVWVYGDRYLDGYQETLTGDGVGSEFTLIYRPRNVNITVDSNIIQPGGVLNMTTVAGSDIKFLIDFESKQIVFTSGTSQGDNIPGIGDSIVIDYMRDLPIVKAGDNQESQDTYGKRVKVIHDKNIKDPLTAEAIMLQELEDFSDPLKQGTLHIKDISNITPGQTCIVDIPFHNINNKTYEILEANYNLDTENLLDDTILSIKVNKNLPDITDTMRDILSQLKKLQGADTTASDIITRFKTSTGSLSIRESGAEIWGIDVGSSFILGHLSLGTLGSYPSHALGNWKTGSTLLYSGGYF